MNDEQAKMQIKQIAQDAVAAGRVHRYTYARQKAVLSAARVQQVDLIETLDLCLQAALDNYDITVGRAVEMFGRFEHLCDCLEKYYARNREEVQNAKMLDDLS